MPPPIAIRQSFLLKSSFCKISRIFNIDLKFLFFSFELKKINFDFFLNGCVIFLILFLFKLLSIKNRHLLKLILFSLNIRFRFSAILSPIIIGYFFDEVFTNNL